MKEPKLKTVYVCSNCGETSPRWMGRCPSCGSWNTMNEDVVAEAPKAGTAAAKQAAAARPEGVTTLTAKRLSEISMTEEKSRIITGISELDRVLGGGIVLGSVVLLGGEPGALRVDDEAGMEQLVSPDQLQAFALSGWRNPWTGIVSCDGPFELLGAALKRTDELIAAARLYWRGMMDASTLCAVLGDRSYLSGEYWRTSPPPEPLEAGRLRAVKRVFMGAKSKAKK